MEEQMEKKKAEKMEIARGGNAAAALDRAAKRGILAQQEESPFARAFGIAEATEELRGILTPKLMEPFMRLQNTSLGFKTDNPAGYPPDVVRDCIIEATLKGVYPVGNEFNIIARQCYITKEGFGHKLKSIPNFSWIEQPGIPRFNAENTGAVIKVRLEWTQNGEKQERELEFAVKANRGMGADAIVGKAIRKARAWLFTAATGQEVGDGDAGEVVDVTPRAATSSPFERPPNTEKREDGVLPM